MTGSLSSNTLTLNRFGLIQVPVGGDKHCGDASALNSKGEVTVKYTVSLVVSANTLDARGFMVDQEALHEFMRSTASTPPAWRESCELLTLIWGQWLLDWMRRTNPGLLIRELTFTLSPAPHAGAFTAVFKP